MNFTYFLTPEEVKQNGLLNTNVDDEYIAFALQEAQSVYLREILGDRLYNSLVNKINDNTITGKYITLLTDYIKIYLGYKMLSLIVVGVNFKIRNMGLVSQFDQGATTANVKDTMYIQEQYNSRAEFYANRLTTYLQKNAADIPEYGYSEDNITQPTTSQNVTGIYLGTGKKRCGCTPTSGGGGGGQADSVEWADILHKPQPTIGAGTVTVRQGETVQTFNVNGTQDTTIELSEGVTDYNDLENTPDLSVYAEKTDVYTKSEIDATTSQISQQIGTKADQSDLTAHTGNGTIHITAQERTDWDGKTTMAAVEAKGYAVAADLSTVATSGSYNDLSNKPTIPAAQVNSDWNAASGVAQILNKPTIPQDETDLGLMTEQWTFTLSTGVNITKTVVLK